MDIILPINLGKYEFSISEEEVLAKYITEPGNLIEFIKKAIEKLNELDNDIVIMKLASLVYYIESLQGEKINKIVIPKEL